MIKVEINLRIIGLIFFSVVNFAVSVSAQNIKEPSFEKDRRQIFTLDKKDKGDISFRRIDEVTSNKARKLYEEALIMGRADDIKAAMARLKEAIELDPGFAASHHELSWCYRMSGQGQYAVGEMEKAVSLDPKSYAYRIDLGHLYMEQNIWLKAIEQLNILWELDFESAKLLEADIVMFRGQNLVLGEVEKDGTIWASRKFEEMTGGKKRAYDVFTEGLKNLESNSIEEAEKNFKEAISLDRTRNLYFLYLSRLYASQQLYNKSAEILESFLKDYPNDPQVLHMLGAVYAALGKNKKAIALWERIKDIDEIIYLTREKWIEIMREYM